MYCTGRYRGESVSVFVGCFFFSFFFSFFSGEGEEVMRVNTVIKRDGMKRAASALGWRKGHHGELKA